jgi:hypothetical protein
MKTSNYKTTDTIDVTNIHPELQTALLKIAKEYKNCTDFAALIPLFSKSILSNKVEGNEYCQLAYRYKETYFAWGINWQTNKACNHPKDLPMPRGLINIYINCMYMFGDSVYKETNSSINKLGSEIECYYYDDLNSSFYFLPEQLKAGLDKINNWYVKTKGSIEGILKQEKIEKLQAELLGLTKVE